MTDYNPKVSIVIRTLNEAMHLKPLLLSIKKQSYDNLETIIVDSGSIDDTVKIAEKLGDKLIKIDQNDFTFGFAINYGIKYAKGEFICILSAHTRPTSEIWLEELVSGFISSKINGKIAMTYGKQIGNNKSNFSEKRDFIKQFSSVDKIQSKPNYFCNNANSMIRKDLWKEHPFDEALTGLEDIEWSKYWMDKGYDIHYKPKAEIFHIHQETPNQIKQRFWREAIAAKSIGVLPIYKLVKQVLLELINILKDLVFSFKENKINKWNEILYYRKNKISGIILSLSHKKFNLRDYSSNYKDLTYKVIEFKKQNQAVETIHQLHPTYPNDILIEVSYVGICETDFEVLRGDLSFYKNGLANYPIIPGHEFSGEIVRVGSKITDYVPGDRVVGQCILSCGNCNLCLSGRDIACAERKEVGVLNYNGAYSEFISLPARFVHKIPDSLSLISASSIEPLAVVLKGLRRIGIDVLINTSKENILVIGAGPIGHLSARVCQKWGNKVTIFDKNRDRLSLLKDVDVISVDTFPSLDKYSYIIECTGESSLARLILSKSSNASSILLLGLPYEKQIIDFEDIVSSDKKIIGSVGSSGDNFREAILLADDLNLDHFNSSVFLLSKWKDAWNEHRSKKQLKVKLKVKSNN